MNHSIIPMFIVTLTFQMFDGVSHVVGLQDKYDYHQALNYMMVTNTNPAMKFSIVPVRIRSWCGYR